MSAFGASVGRVVGGLGGPATTTVIVAAGVAVGALGGGLVGGGAFSGGGQSALLSAKASGGDGAWPSYIERGLDAWRGYFAWLPQGRTTVEYAVRINAAGRFQLPPTRVEAMYSPEIHAALPNRPLDVAP